MALRLTTLLLICTRIRAFAPARPLATKRSAFAPARPLKRSTRLHAVPSVQKRGGDAMILTALSVWQALLRAPWATDPDAYLTVDFEGAVIRGSRLALCLYIAEKVFKALRAPESVREVPVPVEAAAVALLLNLGIKYTLCTCPLPDALAHSVGGSPADVATTYLTIVAWRIIYASRSGRM